METIQNIILPQFDICNEAALYFRNIKDTSYINHSLIFRKYGIADFDTYFNSLTLKKWTKYTQVKNVFLKLLYKGSFKVEVYQRCTNTGEIFNKTVREYYLDSVCDKSHTIIELPPFNSNSFVYFRVIALEEASEFYGGAYMIDESLCNKKDVRISVVICTYKREQYVLNNIKRLKEHFTDNCHSELFGKLNIKIIDNGNTLDNLEDSAIHIYPNKNFGGSGGFTRGIIETMKDHTFSHVLLMDDDVVIETEAIYRLYKFLCFIKPEFEENPIGGSMLKLDFPYIQQEAGVCWNSGCNSYPCKFNLDLRDGNNVFCNEIEENVEINGWWFNCIPMVNIKSDNLPLPVFIRYDDLEYSLRVGKPYILLNGICVWHESFENKYASNLEYYTMRNHLIAYSLHSPGYDSKAIKKFLRHQLINKLYRYRYKDLELNFRAVNDFFKGIDFIKKQNTLQLHQDIMRSGYQFNFFDEEQVKIDYFAYKQNLSYTEGRKKRLLRRMTLNGYLLPARKCIIVPAFSDNCGHYFRAAHVINYDEKSGKGFVTHRDRKYAIKLIIEYFKLCRKIRRNYMLTKKEYLNRIGELTNLEFWNRYLEL